MSAHESIFSHIRLSSIMMGIGAVLAGTACAALRGNTEVLPATLCMIFVIFAQLSGNFYYRYFDVSHSCGTDIDNRIAKHSTRQSVSFLREGSIACLFLALMCGLSLIAMGGWWVIIAGAFTAVLGWLAMGGNLPLLRTPYGIICPFILFGPVCVISTSLLQSMHEATEPLNWFDITPSLYMSIVIGIMCVNATMLYSYANYYLDKRNSKDTFVATCGRKVTRIVFIVNCILYTAVSITMCLMLNLPLNGIDMVPSTLCFILDIYIWWQMRTMPRHQLKSLVDVGNFNVLLMGLLSFLIFELTGVPDDSHMTFFGI